MKKKCVIIQIENEPLLVLPISELDANEYVSIINESKKNLKKYKNEQDQKIIKLQNEINDLLNEIKILKGED